VVEHGTRLRDYSRYDPEDRCQVKQRFRADEDLARHHIHRLVQRAYDVRRPGGRSRGHGAPHQSPGSARRLQVGCEPRCRVPFDRLGGRIPLPATHQDAPLADDALDVGRVGHARQPVEQFGVPEQPGVFYAFRQ